MTIREDEVKKAVSFLEHPQVKPTAGQRKVDFLRRKGLTDDEIREAFQRAGQIYPEDTFTGNSEGEQLDSAAKTTNAPNNVPKSVTPNEKAASQQVAQVSSDKVNANSLPSNQMSLSQPGGVWVPQPFAYVTPQVASSQQPQQKERSWSFGSIFLGAGATAGIVLAIREVLRKYVVPLYFPEARPRDNSKQKPSREDEEGRQYLEKQVDELKTLVKSLVKATERNNDMIEELVHKSERQMRQDLFEVVNCLKSVVSGMQIFKEALHREPSHSEDKLRQDNVAILNSMQGYQREEDFNRSKSEKEVWHSNKSWLVGDDNYSLDANGVGTQIFSNKIRDPGIMDDFMSIPPASLEELVPKAKEVSSGMSTVNDVHSNSNKREGKEEYHSGRMNGSQMTTENMANGTLDEENAKKAFQQAMLAEAKAALERRSHPHSSSRSSPARSVDSERQNTEKEIRRESDNVAIDTT
ncbi:hypothetical protein GpartN1_g1680.t1 [Galdieria partita]|uniref:Peroxisomal membrane protein PEX14 n=1 Tax=Galdieria partita TaxID=83374 RepID=A0A9C7PTA2_9RHOD|nr:hypothetical protein GpartN1_g1680.t1 [Galdieria partita]